MKNEWIKNASKILWHLTGTLEPGAKEYLRARPFQILLEFGSARFGDMSSVINGVMTQSAVWSVGRSLLPSYRTVE